MAQMARVFIQAAEVAVGCCSSGFQYSNETLNWAAAQGKEGASTC